MAEDTLAVKGIPLLPAGMNDNAPLNADPEWYQTRGVHSISERCLQRCNGKSLLRKFDQPILGIHGGIKDHIIVETKGAIHLFTQHDEMVEPEEPFNPGPGLILWLEADNLALSNNAPAAIWPDAGENGNDAVQISGTSQPIYKNDGAFPVLRFDGSNDFMVVPGFTKSVFTAFYVFKGASDGIIGEHSVNAGLNPGDFLFYASLLSCLSNNSTGTGPSHFNTSAPAVPQGVFYLVTRTMDGTNAGHKTWVNGVLTTNSIISTGNPGVGDFTADYFIGAREGISNFLTGDIPAILIYDSVLPDVKRESNQIRLADKYGIILP